MKSGELVPTKLLPLMRCIARDALRDVELLRLDKKRHQHIYLVCVYGSILEIAYGCIVLLDSRQTTALPILFRSFLARLRLRPTSHGVTSGVGRPRLSDGRLNFR
jgi:hypothetical protein